jgi:ribose 5-phosphate isomerase A
MSDLKRRAAEKAVEFVEDGMTLGLGTGSTTFFAIEAIGELVKKGYHLRGVPTSVASEEQARKCGIPLTTLDEVETIDLTIDGADEVDGDLNLIKGMGGALLREKIVAYASKQEIIIVDEAKLVKTLGTRSPLPIEVARFGHALTARNIRSLGCIPELKGGDKPFVTDNGNYVYNCRFEKIDEPYSLDRKIKNIPGVVETGLFLGLATKAVVAYPDRTVLLEK